MSDITFEQAEKLRQHANVSWSEAKEALEQNNGELLSALLWLEAHGKTAAPAGGFYSTRGGTAPAETLVIPHTEHRQKNWQDVMRELKSAALTILRHSTLNHLQIWRKNELIGSIPVIILILLFIVAFYIMLPLTIAGFIFGFRYRFSGPDLGKENINKVMDQVSQSVHSAVEQVKSDFQAKHKK